MNILETFYLVFRGDTENLEKGQKRAEKSTADLQDRIKRTNDATMDLGLSFVAMAERAAAAVGVVVGVGAAIKGAFDVEGQVLDLGRTAKEFGIPIKELQEWQFAAAHFGGTAESVKSSLVGLKMAMQSVILQGGQLTNGPLNALKMRLSETGLTTKTATETDLLYNIADQINDPTIGPRDPAERAPWQVAALKSLGITDNGMIQLLQSGSAHIKALKEQADELGLATDDDARRISAFNDKLIDFGYQLRTVARTIAGPVLDAFNAMPAFVNAHKDQVASFFEAAKIAVIGLALAFVPLAVEILIASAPLILFLAAFGSLYLLINKIGAQRVEGWFSEFGGWIDNVTTKIGKLIALMTVLSDPNLSLKDRAIEAKAIWDDPGDGKNTAAAPQKHAAIISAQQAIGFAARSPISSQTNTSIINGAKSNSASNTVNVGKVEVHTTGPQDADSISKSINGALSKHINSTIRQFSDGRLS